MTVEITEVLHELLRYRESSLQSTRDFRTQQHNADLCPKLEQQLNRVLDSFMKHRQVAYDVQGVHDRGTDVLFRYEVGDDLRFLAFQLKSFDDLKSPLVLKNLRSQCYEAQQEYGSKLEQYFVLLCTDAYAQSSKVREAKKAFGADKLVTVIDPRYSLTFLRMSAVRIAAIVDALMRREDAVYKSAAVRVTDLTPTQAAVLLAVVHALAIDPVGSVRERQLLQNSFVRDAYARFPDMPSSAYFADSDDDDDEPSLTTTFVDRDVDTRLAEDLDALGETALELSGSGIRAHDYYARPLLALMLDAMVRYEYEGEAVLSYLFDTLGITKNFPILTELDL